MAKHLTGEHKKGFFNATLGNGIRGGLLGMAIGAAAVALTGGLALIPMLAAGIGGAALFGGANAAWGGARWTGETVLNGIKGIFGFGKNAVEGGAEQMGQQRGGMGFAEAIGGLLATAFGLQSARGAVKSMFGRDEDNGVAGERPMSAREQRQAAGAMEQSRLDGLTLDVGKDGTTIPAEVLASPEATRDFLQSAQRDARQALQNDTRRALGGDSAAQERLNNFYAQKQDQTQNPQGRESLMRPDGSAVIPTTLLEDSSLFQNGGTGVGNQLVGYAAEQKTQVTIGNAGVAAATKQFEGALKDYGKGKISAEEMDVTRHNLQEKMELRDLAVAGPQAQEGAKFAKAMEEAKAAAGTLKESGAKPPAFNGSAASQPSFNAPPQNAPKPQQTQQPQRGG